jgi:hypothetical protein
VVVGGSINGTGTLLVRVTAAGGGELSPADRPRGRGCADAQARHAAPGRPHPARVRADGAWGSRRPDR